MMRIAIYEVEQARQMITPMNVSSSLSGGMMRASSCKKLFHSEGLHNSQCCFMTCEILDMSFDAQTSSK